jgi:branched-chain amino acid transport system permease protein
MVTDVIVLMDSGSYQVTLAWKQVIIMVITTLLLAGFWYLVQKTSLGRAQRACEQDRKMAALLGINVDHNHLAHLRPSAPRSRPSPGDVP